MENITLTQVHRDLLSLKKEVAHLRLQIGEDYEPSEHVVAAVHESRRRSAKDFVTNEAMRVEFGR